jgi:hypothetical protein
LDENFTLGHNPRFGTSGGSLLKCTDSLITAHTWARTAPGLPCAASATLTPSCPVKTFAEAQQICAANKARLCTAKELINGAYRGTGCDESTRTWASDGCGGNPDRSTTIASGSNQDCSFKSQLMAVRCCLDDASVVDGAVLLADVTLETGVNQGLLFFDMSIVLFFCFVFCNFIAVNSEICICETY